MIRRSPHQIINQSLQNEHGVVQFIGNLNPDVKLPFIAAEQDTGPLVKALVQESAGKNLIGYREWSTLREVSGAFTRATGLAAECVMLPKGQSKIPVPPELDWELEDNWAYCNEFGYEGRDDPTIIHPRDVRFAVPSSSPFADFASCTRTRRWTVSRIISASRIGPSSLGPNRSKRTVDC